MCARGQQEFRHQCDRVLGLSMACSPSLGILPKLVSRCLLAGSSPKHRRNGSQCVCVIGHNWPVYYNFKGGKGIVCSVVVILLCPLEGLLAGAAAILVIWWTRFVSLGSLTFLVVSTITLFITRGAFPYGWWAVILLVMGLFQHRSNISRLISGTENKFSPKRNAS